MSPSSSRTQTLGRYVIYEEVATGGMASVHLARLVGDVGFGRTVAIKRLHPQFARDENFVAMFVDEARLASRIRHPNVASTLDVVQTPKELFVVMEFIHGETLSQLLRPLRASGESSAHRVRHLGRHAERAPRRA